MRAFDYRNRFEINDVHYNDDGSKDMSRLNVLIGWDGEDDAKLGVFAPSERTLALHIGGEGSKVVKLSRREAVELHEAITSFFRMSTIVGS